jgi:hypothetical protein
MITQTKRPYMSRVVITTGVENFSFENPRVEENFFIPYLIIPNTYGLDEIGKNYERF